MLRRLPALVVVAFAVAGCAPAFDVTVAWTIDGDDPASVCEFLPKGSVVRVTTVSRDISDPRAPTAAPVATDFSCDTGSGIIQIGNFSRVQAQIVADDQVFGTSAPLEIDPGAAGSGYQADDAPVTTDIRLIRGTLTANLTVNGQTCDVAGVSAFSVSLFENTEPLANVPVVEAVNVACSGSEAVFSHSPVDIDSDFVIQATASAGEDSFATSSEGKGVRTIGVNTFLTVDLDTVE